MASQLDRVLIPDQAPEATEDLYLNRELSWLDYSWRVLAMAEREDVPPLERAKFLAIFRDLLDEFFQVRVAGLKDQEAAGLGATSPDGRTAGQQLAEIRQTVLALVQRQDDVFLSQVSPALAANGIQLSDWDELDDDDRKYMVEVFEGRIFPVLTPLAVDPGHPFPYISNLSLNLAVLVRNPETGEHRFARVKVPQVLPRFVVMPDGERYVPLEQVIAAHLGLLFPGMDIVEHHPFRVIRNADLTLEEEEADDLLAAVELELRRRRFGNAVHLEVCQGVPPHLLDLLVQELDLRDDDVYVYKGPLDLGGLWAVHALDRPDLKDHVWTPVTPVRLAITDEGDDLLGTPRSGTRKPVSVFDVLRAGDVLVHHPYTSFTASVGEFIRQASVDPSVLAIKITLYRTSGDSPIVKSLIRAAEQGKQVVALVELKARFDERANIEWARQLEAVGVHVVYGLVGLKTHSKTALVVREEEDGVRRYCHVATGNYNPRTARIYEDLGLLSADPDLGADLSMLFNYLTGYGRPQAYRKLLVGPMTLRPRLRELIEREMAVADGSGRIVMKMNALVDPEMVELLYAASRAGVEIDLVVRGICCLRPGVPGHSDRIRVRSIVGRYLEHSRIFYFAHGGADGEPAYYIGSADLMERNLDRRVEAVIPVEDPALQARLDEVLQVNLADDVLAWELGPDGVWSRAIGDDGVETHQRLQELATARVREAAEPVRG